MRLAQDQWLSVPRLLSSVLCFLTPDTCLPSEARRAKGGPLFTLCHNFYYISFSISYDRNHQIYPDQKLRNLIFDIYLI